MSEPHDVQTDLAIALGIERGAISEEERDLALRIISEHGVAVFLHFCRAREKENTVYQQLGISQEWVNARQR